MLKLADKLDGTALSAWQVTAEGYIDARARISRAGIYEYRAFELFDLFKDREPDSIVRVYRPADEVFKAESMASFAQKPVTDNHPWEPVHAGNFKEHAVGWSGEVFTRDGNFVAGKLRITDAAAVNRVQRGEGELSAGYEADITRESGVYEGEAYDAVMRNIVGNHIALVDVGRCGPVCRVGDRAPTKRKDAANTKDVNDCTCSKTESAQMTTPPAAALQQVTYDSFVASVDANGAAIINTLKQKLADAVKAGEQAQAKADADKIAHDKAIAGKDAEIKKLQDGAMTPEAISKLVVARGKLLADAGRVLGDTSKIDATKSDAEIRLAVVTAAIGDEKVKGKSEAYVEAMFDNLVDAAGDGQQQDNLRSTFQNHRQDSAGGGDAASKAYEEHLASLRDAYKPKPAA